MLDKCDTVCICSAYKRGVGLQVMVKQCTLYNTQMQTVYYLLPMLHAVNRPTIAAEGLCMCSVYMSLDWSASHVLGS